MEEAFFDVPLYREFAQLEDYARLPDESTILRFRHRLEQHQLAEQILTTVNQLLIQQGLLLKVGSVVDATLIPAPTSTKNKDKTRDPEMHSSKKGNQWYFGMKAHIGADADSGLVPYRATARLAMCSDVSRGQRPAARRGSTKCMAMPVTRVAAKRPDAKASINWHVAMRPGKRRALNKDKPSDALIDQLEKLKAGIRAKVEHPFRVIKRQFGFAKVRYKGLKKNMSAQLANAVLLLVQSVDGAAQTDGATRDAVSAWTMAKWVNY